MLHDTRNEPQNIKKPLISKHAFPTKSAVFRYAYTWNKQQIALTSVKYTRSQAIGSIRMSDSVLMPLTVCESECVSMHVYMCGAWRVCVCTYMYMCRLHGMPCMCVCGYVCECVHVCVTLIECECIYVCMCVWLR